MPTIQEVLFNGLREAGTLLEEDLTPNQTISAIDMNEFASRVGDPPKRATPAPIQTLPQVDRTELIKNAELVERLNPNAITPEGVPTLTELREKKGFFNDIVGALEKPQVQDLLVSLGNVFLGSDGSDPLTQFHQNLTQDRRAQEVLNALREGRPEDQGLTLGLDPRRREFAQAQFNTEREQDRRERGTDLQEKELGLREQQVLADLGFTEERIKIARTEAEIRREELELTRESREANLKIDQEIAQARKAQIEASTLLDRTRASLLDAQAEEEKDASSQTHLRLAISFINGLRGSMEAHNERIDALRTKIDRESIFVDREDRADFVEKHPLQSTIKKLEEANADLLTNTQTIQQKTFDDLVEAGFDADEAAALGIEGSPGTDDAAGTNEDPIILGSTSDVSPEHIGKWISINGRKMFVKPRQ